jgi:hypothetical protein
VSTRRHRAWCAQAERAALRPDVTAAQAAQAVWAALPPAQQYRVIEAVAQTRAADFTRQFRNVVGLAVGRRERGGSLQQELVLVFLVRSKTAPSRLAAAQRLPSVLLAPAGEPGRSPLCAVPTDVQPAQGLESVRAQLRSGVAVDGFGGSLCWPVRVGARRFMLAPLHVLSPAGPLGDGSLVAGHAIRARSAGERLLGRSEAIGGSLQAPPHESFDVQLASVAPGAAQQALRAVFADLRLDAELPAVTEGAQIDALGREGSLRVLVPDENGAALRGPLRASFRRHFQTPVPLSYETDSGVAHPVQAGLVELQIEAGLHTIGGDSGAPVLGGPDGACTFVGMHIAGNRSRGISLLIPAWDLLEPQLYAELPAGRLRLGW